MRSYFQCNPSNSRTNFNTKKIAEKKVLLAKKKEGFFTKVISGNRISPSAEL
jgi:hypothetical protein